MEKLIITAAICGAEVTKDDNPAVPYTISEMVREAVLAYNAGASIIHLHVREDDGTPTQNINRYKQVINAIKEAIPEVIIQVSTGGALGMSIEERTDVLNLKPEMATLDCGSVNFGGDEVFINTENDIIYVAKKLQENNVRAELECFEKGHIDLVLRLLRKKIIDINQHFSFVLGVNGGMSGEERDFFFLKDSIPNTATYSVAGIGRFELPLAKLAIKHGGHVRVGLEDNLYVSKGVLAKSNAELVNCVVEIAKKENREIASANEARRILGLMEGKNE